MSVSGCACLYAGRLANTLSFLALPLVDQTDVLTSGFHPNLEIDLRKMVSRHRARCFHGSVPAKHLQIGYMSTGPWDGSPLIYTRSVAGMILDLAGSRQTVSNFSCTERLAARIPVDSAVCPKFRFGCFLCYAGSCTAGTVPRVSIPAPCEGVGMA